MKILCLETYYGGSHRAFLDGWRSGSRHEWTVLTLPASKWKWRMRHAAITFADQVRQLAAQGQAWDVLFCSDMLNLAEFVGLCPEPMHRLRRVVYFHENQLTYPVRVESERDYQYVMTNLTTALAADGVWFNSGFHRDEFLDAARKFLKRMPDFQPLEAVERIAEKTAVHSPGIEPIEPGADARGGAAPVVLWAARWEHDKNPEDFFAVVEKLANKGLAFRINVIGEQFRERPAVFDWAAKALADRIGRWGYQPSRGEYLAALRESDIVVSTAAHEFFGIGVLEAIAAGCRPLLPNRLAYPQLLTVAGCEPPEKYLYNGTAGDLCVKLESLIRQCAQIKQNGETFFAADKAIESRFWPRHAAVLDGALAEV